MHTEKDLTHQLQRLMSALQVAEQHAKQVLQTARAKRRSFGLTYNYLDEDIAHLRGRVRYMQLMARQWEEETPAREQPTAERVTIFHHLHDAPKAQDDAQRSMP